MDVTSRAWSIPTKNEVRSLVWVGDTLVDWASGGTRYAMNGSATERPVTYAFPFDAACTSPSGEYAVLYTRLGTKGLVLREGEIVREINRSFYHADVYEYPVAIARLPSGQEVLVHCPDEYNRLEIDDLETGSRLTVSESRKPCDFFHSRLATDGTFLLSAGWVWQPVDAVVIHRLHAALTDARTLDGTGLLPMPGTEITTAAFMGGGHIVMATSDETFLDEDDFASPDAVRPSSLVVWDLNSGKRLTHVPVHESIGTMMSLGDGFVASFFDHPKVFDLATGQVVWRLADLKTGTQISSIVHHLGPQPVLALDHGRSRFAVAAKGEIRVTQLHCKR